MYVAFVCVDEREGSEREREGCGEGCRYAYVYSIYKGGAKLGSAWVAPQFGGEGVAPACLLVYSLLPFVWVTLQWDLDHFTPEAASPAKIRLPFSHIYIYILCIYIYILYIYLHIYICIYICVPYGPPAESRRGHLSWVL